MALNRIYSIILAAPLLMVLFSQSALAYKDIKHPVKRRNAFMQLVATEVNAINANLLVQRAKLLGLHETFQKEKKVPLKDEKWLQDLAKTFGFKTTFDASKGENYEELLRRVDIIPVSLAIAQAGCESSWGDSYFARKGNNLFGHMCIKKGCGMPLSAKVRENSSEAKRFDSVGDSIHAYVHNLNIHPAYETLRKNRESLRKKQKPIDGTLLADGLHKYSTRGQYYVKYIKNLIKDHKLDKIELDSKAA